METSVKIKKPHSAEYFGEYRDFWWNADFLELMGKRLQLKQVRTVLDIGCGVGHWGQILAPLLHPEASVTGIDREETWVAQAAQRAKSVGLEDRFQYRKGDVTALPFEDNTFDLVTCQTVLIHLKDPSQGLLEMLRVLKPGGMILAAEPNNFANRAVSTSLTERLSIEEVLDRLRFELTIQRGKQALGLGFNSVGDLIPGTLAELGAENLRVYVSDKAVPFFAPYSNQEQSVNIEQMKSWAKRDFMGWDRDEVLGYFIAGGGQEEDFERIHQVILQDARDAIQAIDHGTYHSAGGGIMYLIAAQKPRQ